MNRMLLGIAALPLLWLAQPASGQGSSIAVIVHPTNSVSDISLDELRRLYMGSTVLFGARQQRVALAELESERMRFYRLVLSMNEDRVKRHWIGLVFAGEAATPPETFMTVDDVKQFVASRPGAIAFIPLQAVDSNVKQLTVEGLPPGHPSYPLRN